MLDRAWRVVVLGLAATALQAAWIAVAHAQATCPPACAGQTLTTPNFSHQNLAGASFEGATLVGATFVRANLTGANFDKAIFKAVDGSPTQTPDFTFADLTHATFIGAQFLSPTYFTYATLTCADFSQTDLATGKAIFGDEPLIYTTSPSCRTKFQGTTMNCEFIDDWRNFDLTSAVITACITQLAGRDFSNAVMSSVSFVGAVLDGVDFNGANLVSAVLDNASLQCATIGGNLKCVDLSDALLQGAQLNQANFTGASLYRAFLSNNENGNVSDAASARQAHFKNVNLSFAELSGVDFSFANFYGTVHSNPSGCSTSGANNAGFTNNCASAMHANIAGTTFTDAYLYGVDFRNATIAGANFSQSVLAGANFSGASISTFAGLGTVTSFDRAYLQGTNLDQATLSDANFTNAFVDFRGGGNIISIDLDGLNHNQFACSNPSTCKPPSASDICVEVPYSATTVPTSNTTITCPDGLPAGASGCGTADPSGGNARWKSAINIGQPPDPGPPPGWYVNNSTYTPKTSGPTVCKGGKPTINW